MSSEGYEQALCLNGHYNIHDQYEHADKCDIPGCDAILVWFNGVDTTNGCSYNDKIGFHGGHDSAQCQSCGMKVHFDDKKSEMIHIPSKIDTCPTCNHSKLLEHTKFKFPINAGRWEDPIYKQLAIKEGRIFKVDKEKFPLNR